MTQTYIRTITAMAMAGILIPAFVYLPTNYAYFIVLVVGYCLYCESIAMMFPKSTVWGWAVGALCGVLLAQQYLTQMIWVVSALWCVRALVMMLGHRSMGVAKVFFVCQWLDISVFVVAFMQLLTQHPLWLCWLLVLIVGVDSCGYFVGRRFGKHQIVPSISPKKTREGYLGAAVWCVFVGGIIMNVMEISILRLTLLVSVVYILAITGDLFVSYQKRILNVKDSGHLLPGHGGFLDRFDSWLLVIPVTFLLVNIN